VLETGNSAEASDVLWRLKYLCLVSEGFDWWLVIIFLFLSSTSFFPVIYNYIVRKWLLCCVH
jgi:hypothetical protein